MLGLLPIWTWHLRNIYALYSQFTHHNKFDVRILRVVIGFLIDYLEKLFFPQLTLQL